MPTGTYEPKWSLNFPQEVLPPGHTKKLGNLLKKYCKENKICGDGTEGLTDADQMELLEMLSWFIHIYVVRMCKDLNSLIHDLRYAKVEMRNILSRNWRKYRKFTEPVSMDIALEILSCKCRCGKKICGKKHCICSWLSNPSNPLDVFLVEAVCGFIWVRNHGTPRYKAIPYGMFYHNVKEQKRFDLDYVDVLFNECPPSTIHCRAKLYEKERFGGCCSEPKCKKPFDKRVMKTVSRSEWLIYNPHYKPQPMWKCKSCGNYFLFINKATDQCPINGCSYTPSITPKAKPSMKKFVYRGPIFAENIDYQQLVNLPGGIIENPEFLIENRDIINDFISEHPWLWILFLSIYKGSDPGLETVRDILEGTWQPTEDYPPLDVVEDILCYPNSPIKEIKKYRRKILSHKAALEKESQVPAGLNEIDKDFEEMKSILRNHIISKGGFQNE